jgi:Ran GTPase-activating protein (RanGAP) involved in mRNA processing and transport
MVRKQAHSTRLHLSHLSIGDTVATLFADSVGDLRDVESVDLNDNKLTDASLGPLAMALSKLPCLTELDFGRC